MNSLLVFTLANAFMMVSCLTWTKLLGEYSSSISAKGDELWSIKIDGQDCSHTKIFHLSGSGWSEKTKGAECASNIAASPDGYAFVIRPKSASTNDVIRFNPSKQVWETVYNGKAVFVNAASPSNFVTVETTNGDSSGLPGTVVQVLDGKSKQIESAGIKNSYAAIGDDNEFWRLEEGEGEYGLTTLHRFDNQRSVWVKQEVHEKMSSVIGLQVQSANRVIVIDYNNDVWMWNGSTWKQLNDPAFAQPKIKCPWATINRKSVFCKDGRGEIYKLDV